MKKKDAKITHAAHIKSNTHGTSNEISFSVLDAAKQSMDGGKKSSTGKMPSLGFIPVITFGLRKKPPATPVKEQGIMLPSGEFVSTEGGSSGMPLLPAASQTTTSLEKGGLSDAKLSDGASGLGATAAVSVTETVGGALASAANATAEAVASSARSSSGTSWVASQEEVARRKSTRKRRKAFVVTLLVVAFLAALAAVGWTVYQSFEQKQTVRGQLIAQIETIEQADAVIFELDEMVVNCINKGWENLPEGTASRFAELQDEIAEADATLAAASASIGSLKASIEDPYDQEAAAQAVVAAEARRAMIESGLVIMAEAIGAQEAFAYADQAWLSLIEGDTLAREAAQLASDTSKETVALSTERSKAALDAFENVAPNLRAAEAALEGLDYSEYDEYVELRMQAIDHAILSNQAYLDRNKEKAAAENDRYNELDTQAAALAQEIGHDPAGQVLELVEPRIKPSMDAYSADRARASVSDTSLREYLTP